jgi:hypothetical protein
MDGIWDRKRQAKLALLAFQVKWADKSSVGETISLENQRVDFQGLKDFAGCRGILPR